MSELAGSPDRRTRKRAARREALLEMAADVVAESGVDGLTMSALADVSDYAPASLYTYFASRSALVAALQQRALSVLADVARTSVELWSSETDNVGDAGETDVARLWAFSRLFLSAPDHHPREFALQQELLVAPEVEDVADAASVVPAAMVVLDVPRQLLEQARTNGSLQEAGPRSTPLDKPPDEPLDTDLVRTLAWVSALNGAMLVDRLSTGLPTTGRALGAEITRTLLIGWGADPSTVDRARQFSEQHLTVPPPPGQTRSERKGAR